MKVNTVGMLVELEKIPFPVGTIVGCQFSIDDSQVLIEKVRSIKHYDRFYRNKPSKKVTDDQIQVTPKKLCEFHFIKILEVSRTAIQKFILLQQSQPAAPEKKK